MARGAGDDALDLDAARDQLYAGRPADFVAARGALARQARAAGDRELAAAIQALRRPTQAAWIVNLLARSRPDAVGELLELGRDLREGMAGADGDGLREATRRRHQVVTGLVRLAREVAAEQGQKVGDEVARSVQLTLEATLSDSDSADLVAAGCLSEPLEVSGFGGAFGLGLVPPPSGRPSKGGGSDDGADDGDGNATVTDLADRRARKTAEIAEAEQGLEDAERLSRQAEQGVAAAQDNVVEEERRAERASDRIDRLEAKLEEARAELAERTQAAKAARQVAAEAEKAMRAATRALAAATERLRRLRR